MQVTIKLFPVYGPTSCKIKGDGHGDAREAMNSHEPQQSNQEGMTVFILNGLTRRDYNEASVERIPYPNHLELTYFVALRILHV